jgi:DNA-binding NarL/FixJ family response regulator
MPGMNGYQTYLELKNIVPHLRALFVSGLPVTAEIHELCKAGVAEFLSKPFREEELIPALKRLAALVG